MNARFTSNFPSQRTKRSSLNECSQRKSVLRVTPAAMIRLSRSQSPFRESRSTNYEYKARSYGDAGTSSSDRQVPKTTTPRVARGSMAWLPSRPQSSRGLKNANDFRSEKERDAAPAAPQIK